jgi:hypothetical protein
MVVSMIATNEELRAQLSSGERLLWSGQPRQGLVLRGSDTFAIPFSLMWGGFAIFWESSVLDSSAPGFFVFWGIPFVLIGLYLIIGRFFVDAKQRAHTFYGVTNERIIIVTGVLNRSVKSLNLRTLSDISLTEGKNDEGSISFGGGSQFYSRFGGISGWPGMNAQMGPRFDLIAGARTAYDIIRNAQRLD